MRATAMSVIVNLLVISGRSVWSWSLFLLLPFKIFYDPWSIDWAVLLGLFLYVLFGLYRLEVVEWKGQGFAV